MQFDPDYLEWLEDLEPTEWDVAEAADIYAECEGYGSEAPQEVNDILVSEALFLLKEKEVAISVQAIESEINAIVTLRAHENLLKKGVIESLWDENGEHFGRIYEPYPSTLNDKYTDAYYASVIRNKKND